MIVEVCQCRGCGSNTQLDDRYCQECGAFLDDLSRRITDGGATSAAAEFLTRLSPGAAKPVVQLPVVAGIIILLIVIPLLGYTINNSYQAISSGFLEHEAAQQLANGHPDQAVAICDRIKLTRKLTDSQQQLLNNARFKLADQLIATSKYGEAFIHLSRITSDFAQSDQVKERMQVCQEYSGQQPVTAKTATASKPRLHSKPHIVKVAASGAVASKSEASSPTATAAAEEKTDAAAKPTLAPTTEAITSAAPKPKVAESSADNNNTMSLAALPKYSHADVARYNELLAVYFASSKAAGKEPPSISEWVGAGRPKF
ncbi:MAG TPA: hypothetical protein V6C81_18755 [Planktothrix sp.]|jgi:hypothetical protein